MMSVLRYISILVVAVLAFSCSSDADDAKKVFETYYSNGKLKFRGETVDTMLWGLTASYYENGELQSEIMYEKDIKHGPAKLYSETGEMSYTEYKNGMVDGKVQKFDSNGRLTYSAVFRQGQIYGTEVIYYYDKGTIKRNTYDNEQRVQHYELTDLKGKKIYSMSIPTIESEADTVELGGVLKFNIILRAPVEGDAFVLVYKPGSNYKDKTVKPDTIRSSDNKTFPYRVKVEKIGENSVKGVVKYTLHKADTASVNSLSFVYKFFVKAQS